MQLGYHEFVHISTLRPGLDCDDSYNDAVQVRIRIEEVEDALHLCWNSRKETG